MIHSVEIAFLFMSFKRLRLEREQIRVVSKTKHSKTKTEARSTQNSKTKHPISKTKHPKLENEAPYLENEDPKISKTKHSKLENEDPQISKTKTRNHCRFNKGNFTSYTTQSESGGGSGCVRTSKGPQNPSQGFITKLFH